MDVLNICKGGRGDTDATFLFCRGGVCGGFCLAGLDVEFFFRFGFCVGHVGVWRGRGEVGWVGMGWLWLVVLEAVVVVGIVIVG